MSLITEVGFSLRDVDFNQTADLLQRYQLDDLFKEDLNNPVPFARFTVNKFESFQFYAGKISVSNSDDLYYWIEFAAKVAHTHQGIIELKWNNVIFEVECHQDFNNLSNHIHSLFSDFMNDHCREVKVDGNMHCIYLPSAEQNHEDIIFSYSFCRRVNKLLLAYGDMPNRQCVVSDVGLEVESADEIIAMLNEQNFKPLLTSALSLILR